MKNMKPKKINQRIAEACGGGDIEAEVEKLKEEVLAAKESEAVWKTERDKADQRRLEAEAQVKNYCDHKFVSVQECTLCGKTFDVLPSENECWEDFEAVCNKIKTEAEAKVYTFAVITKIPNNNEEGNKYDDFLIRNRVKEADNMTMHNACGYKSYRQYNDGEIENIPNKDIIDVSLPVFNLGEVLILDNNGREATGRGRKPSKWSVEVEEFNNLNEAIECSNKVLWS